MAAVKNMPRGVVALVIGVFVLGGLALATRSQWDWLLEDDEVAFEVPAAPELIIEDENERRFTIDSERSSVEYEVEERLVGSSTTAIGSTRAVAGDIVLAMDDPQASTVGTVVVNLETLTSDSSLRDKRLRHDFLESSHHRFAEFAPTAIIGWPDEIVDGTSYDIEITGDLTVKETTATEVFSGTATLDGDDLTVDVSADLLMSTYDVGPISVSGLVSTGDDVVLRLSVVAVDVTERTSPLSTEDIIIAEQVSVDLDGSNLFSREVMPILADHCAGCHNAGGPGFSTWELIDAADVADVADDIDLLTHAGYMPPWPASELSVAFRDDWSLDETELAAIRAWVQGGAVIDVEPDTPITAGPVGFVPIDRDLVVNSIESYQGSTDRRDDYRCLIYDPQVTEPMWVRGYGFEPDQVEVVHHAIVTKASAAARADADRRDAQEEGAGWTCYTGGSSLNGPTERAYGWAPGGNGSDFGPDAGQLLEPGDFFVVQVHYHFDHEAPADNSTFIVDLHDPADVEAAGGSLIRLTSQLYLGPAEIPCPADAPTADSPQCQRATEIARIAREYGDISPFLPDFMLGSCGQSAADYAHMTDGTASSTCDLAVENPGEIVSLTGHMHEIGAAIKLTLNPDTDREIVLLDIPVWSFDWQLGYRPTESIVITTDDVIRVECWWDRGLRHDPEPRYIAWSEGTLDEMCYSSITTRPVR